MSHNAICVIIERLTKSAHFLAMETADPLSQLAKLYIQEIVCLPGIVMSIVSDQDSRFTSRFWSSFQDALGTYLSFSTVFHLQTNG